MDSLAFLISSRETNRYGIIASLVVLFYDYALTFSLEVELFWTKSRLTWPSFFFFLSRYSALIVHIPIAVEFFSDGLSSETCHILAYLHRIYSFYAVILVGILQMIRTHALFGQNLKVLALLLLLSVTSVGVGSWAFVASRHHPSPGSFVTSARGRICAIPMSNVQGKYLTIAWSSAVVFDTAIFSLTLYRRIRMGVILSDGLFSLILRDGTMYYGILIILYIADLIDLSIKRGIGEVVTITNAVATMLICRLMLNIRNLEYVTDAATLTTSTVLWEPMSQASNGRYHSEIHSV